MAPTTPSSQGRRARLPGQLFAEVTLVVVLLAALGLYWPAGTPNASQPAPLSIASRQFALRAFNHGHVEDDLSRLRNVPWHVPVATNWDSSPPAVASAAPVQLLIAALGLHPLVESVSVDRSGAMSVPRNYFDVAWYNLGAVPGDPGDAVIDGHAGFPDKPLVFGKLDKLRWGDKIVVVLADGGQRYFSVESVKTWPWRAHPTGLFQADGPARLTLITCTGKFDDKTFSYADRLVVEARYTGTG